MALVETRYGAVEGFEKAGVLQFRGVPYAAPPVGARRWRPPQPPEPWTGVWQADHFRASAPQDFNRTSPLPTSPPHEASEDCLYLNVFTDGTGGEPRPVMVWIHGGGFTAGSGRNAWYNGASFARHGVVVVTINYRLGALGFLHLGDDFPGSANCAVLDQLAALRWVHESIAAFGGDAGNVTIFGESAGGMSVATLMGTPAAAGLFAKAVPQSGAASNVHDLEQAAEVAERLSGKLGGTLQDLLTAPVERLLAAQGEVVAETTAAGRGLPFVPVVDGVVIPRPPLEAVGSGTTPRVKLLTGTNRDETTLFFAATPGFAEVTEDGVVRRLEHTGLADGRAVYDEYRSVLGASAAPRDVWVAIETDRRFRVPAIRLAEAAGRHTPDVWMYLFTWESPALDGLLRACHALEIPFVWNTLDVPGTERFTGAGAEADALASAMHEVWVAFARAGDPGWGRYETSRRATRVFGPDGGVVDDPMAEARSVWEERLQPTRV
jgi:para-nitrobenzyl esterase